MARKHEAQELLRQGNWPGKIARLMRVTDITVIQYLQLRVGEGELRLSDILYSYPAPLREALGAAADGRRGSMKELVNLGLSKAELALYNRIMKSNTLNGDMYQSVSEFEMMIHSLVKHTLVKQFGSDLDAWWWDGVPMSIRTTCVQRHQLDNARTASPFEYTNFIELLEVIEKRWPQFEAVVPSEYRSNRKLLSQHLRRMNAIRNAVMHPVKGREWSQEDFEFVRMLTGRVWGSFMSLFEESS